MVGQMIRKTILLSKDDKIDLGNGKTVSVGQILSKLTRLEKRIKKEEDRYHMTAEEALIVSKC